MIRFGDPIKLDNFEKDYKTNQVETVKKGLEEILVNKTIKNINLSGFSLRFPIPKNFVSLAAGKKILSIGSFVFAKINWSKKLILGVYP